MTRIPLPENYAQRVAGLLDELARDRPDERVRCTYVKREGTVIRRCIAGEVLHVLGIADETLASFDGEFNGNDGMNIDAVAVELFGAEVSTNEPHRLGRRPLPWTPEQTATRLLELAQELQDQGWSWGTAVPRAKNALARETSTAS